MGKKEKVTCLGETVKSADEESVSTEEATDNYEVGYGKPPKNNQFQKGVLGNPRWPPQEAPRLRSATASRGRILRHHQRKRAAGPYLKA